ncbi:DUF4190 domain-containing protein [Mycetocola saprophilus]|uniref:DUF4190 domain-containing protein n=1 Tax=Mycetocola saprophilus TaxID=76636 RepID=UPI003BF235F7
MSGTEPNPEGTPQTPPPAPIPPVPSAPPGGAYAPNLPPYGYPQQSAGAHTSAYPGYPQQGPGAHASAYPGYPQQGPGAHTSAYPGYPAQQPPGRPAPEALTIVAFITSFVLSPIGMVLGIVQTVRERDRHGRASGLALASIWVGAGLSVITFVAGVLLALSFFVFSGLVASSGVIADSYSEEAPRADTVSAEFCESAQDLTPLLEPLASLDADGYAEHVGDGGTYAAETEFMIKVAGVGETLWDSAPTSIVGEVETMIDSSWYTAEGFEGSGAFDPQDLHDAQSAAIAVSDFATEHCTTP